MHNKFITFVSEFVNLWKKIIGEEMIGKIDHLHNNSLLS